MPTSCVVGGCTRNSFKNPEIHFVQFPRDPAISKEWVKFVNNTRKDFTFLARSRPLICSAHFSEDCIEPSSALKKTLGLTTKFRLKPGSIPTLKAPNIERIRVSTTTRPTATTLAESSASAGSAVADSGAESQKGLLSLKRNVGGFSVMTAGTAFQKRERSRTEPEQARLKKHTKSTTHGQSHKAAKLRKTLKIKISAELGKTAKSKTSNGQEKSDKKLKPIIIKLKKPDGLLALAKRKAPPKHVIPAELEKVTKFKKSTKLKKPAKGKKTAKLETPACTKLRTPTKSRTPVDSEEAAKLRKSLKLEKHGKPKKAKSKKLTNLKESVELETHSKSKQICAAYGCSHPRVKFGCTFYSFPKDKKLAKKWLRAAKCDVAENKKTGTQLITGKHLRLCNCHFEKRPNPKNRVVPTIFFNATSSLETEPVSKSSPQEEGKSKRKKSLDPIQDEQPKKSSFQENGFWKHYNQLKEESSRYKEACCALKLLSLSNIKDSDIAFEIYTGLPNYRIFKLLHDYMKSDAKEIKPDPSQINEDVGDAEMNSEQSLTSEEELFLFLVGSRTGNSVSDLAVRFGVSEETYRFIFASWAVFVSSKLEDLYRTVGVTDVHVQGSDMCVAVDFTALFSNSPSVLHVKNQNFSRCKLRKLAVLSLNDKGAVTGVITMLDGEAVVTVAPNKYLDFTSVHNQFTQPPLVKANIVPKMSLVDIDRTLDRIKRFSYLRQQVNPMELDIFERVFKACAYLTNFQSAFRMNSTNLC